MGFNNVIIISILSNAPGNKMICRQANRYDSRIVIVYLITKSFIYEFLNIILVLHWNPYLLRPWFMWPPTDFLTKHGTLASIVLGGLHRLTTECSIALFSFLSIYQMSAPKTWNCLKFNSHSLFTPFGQICFHIWQNFYSWGDSLF